MKQTIASFIIFILLLLCGNNLLAQYKTTSFYTKQYKAADGLPDSYILNIYQDTKKYLWIGTYSGLSRFDGTSFTNFGIHNGFTDLYINHIIEFNGRFWVGARNGIGYFEKNRFTPTPVNDSLKIDFVFGFGEVIPGKLWAFTSKGLYELEGNKWIKQKYIPGRENEACRGVFKKDDVLYFSFYGVLVKRFNDGRTTQITTQSKTLPYFLNLSKSGNRLFVNTPDGMYELKNDELIPIFSSELNNKLVYSYLVDSKGRFWVATEEDGIMVSDPGNEQVFSHKIPMPIKLVSRIFEDAGHNIWIASFQGLIKIKTSFFEQPDLPGPPAEDHRFIPAYDKNGALYFYDEKNGLMESDEKGLYRKKFPDPQNILQEKATSTVIDAISIDHSQNFWVATRGNGLYKINHNGKQELMKVPDGDYANEYFTSICWDTINQKMYCGGRKLFVYEHNGFHEIIDKKTNLPIGSITKILVLRNGNALVNSRVTGLWMIKPNGNVYALTQRLNLPVDFRLQMVEDKQGKIWIAITGIGLQRFSWVNDSTLNMETEVSTMNGLPNDVIDAIAIDSKNRLWAATLSGLIVMDTLSGTQIKKFVMYHVGKQQGLNFSIHSGLTKMINDKYGNIWLCSAENIIHFYSNELDIGTDPPVTHIERLLLNMKETDWGRWSTRLDGYFMLPANLELPHNQNTLTFYFKGINHNSDEKIWYSYKLVGVDTNWLSTTEANVTSYIKLSPGHFTFAVRARNNNSPWSDPAMFSFTIKPPFWKTWWFRTIGILAASCILVLIFRTQLKRINKKAVLQNQLRNLEMKALKAQMNPHFVYNALNSIQSLVIDNRQQEALDYMVKFSRLLRQVLNHSEQNVVTLEKELAALKLYIELEALRLHYSLNYSIEVDEQILQEKEWVPPLILQPFVENALWHGLGNKEGEKKLIIQIHGNDHWLICKIIDNGIGRFNNTRKDTISYKEGPRGMDITTNRLNLYNESPGSASIDIEDNLKPDGSSAGTTVIIRIRRK